MPPRTNEPILGPFDVRYEPVATYYDPYVDPYYDDRRNTVTIDTDRITLNTPFTTTNYVTREEMADFAQKIYEVMLMHTKIDITEEEFMKLVLEK